MAIFKDKYTEGGIPSNRQVVGVKTTTIDFSKLQEGPAVEGDLVQLFTISATEKVIAAGYNVIEETTGAGAANIGLGSFGNEIVSTADFASIGAFDATGTFDAGVSGIMTVSLGSFALVTGIIEVWCVVANISDPATLIRRPSPHSAPLRLK